MAHKIVNIIPEHKFFVWLPEKTSSTHAYDLLQNYKIIPYEVKDGYLVKKLKGVYSHNFDLFKGHEEYKLMSTARNPYSRFVSYYLFMGGKRITENFYDYLYHIIVTSGEKKFHFSERTPDYFVRMENLVEDYSKIPFIQNSDFYKSGKLESLCNIKRNTSRESYNFKDYYDQMSADLVYYNFSKYFEMLGYDKDSWKK